MTEMELIRELVILTKDFPVKDRHFYMACGKVKWAVRVFKGSASIEIFREELKDALAETIGRIKAGAWK